MAFASGILPPACANALAGDAPPAGLMAADCIDLSPPKFVCADACACPLSPSAVDCASALLPFTVWADDLAYALPAMPGGPTVFEPKESSWPPIPPAPPVADAVAIAAPPCKAVEVAVA